MRWLTVNKSPILWLRNVSVEVKGRLILHPLSLEIFPNTLVSFLGPSGTGKSTLLKCLNRLNELVPALHVEGKIYFHGKNIRSSSIPVEELRQKIGMVFQAPVIFPGSIAKNVLFGVRRLMPEKKRRFGEILERSLREAALWDEVKDRLDEKAETLSVGQKQRLTLARVLALRPEIILLDEPTSSLDPQSTGEIEELLARLKFNHTLILVTHDHDQARKVSDVIVQMGWEDGAGKLVSIMQAAQESEPAERRFFMSMATPS